MSTCKNIAIQNEILDCFKFWCIVEKINVFFTEINTWTFFLFDTENIIGRFLISADATK